MPITEATGPLVAWKPPDMQAKRTSSLFVSRRANPRFPYTLPFTVRYDDQIVQVKAINLSMGGVSGEIRGIGALPERKAVSVHLQNYPPVAGKVRWTRGREVGISFTEDLANHPQVRGLVSRIENGEPAELEPRST